MIVKNLDPYLLLVSQAIAFIYTKLLNTLKKNDFINDQDFELFYENCSTITKKMQIGLNKIKEKGYKKKIFARVWAPKTLYIFNIK